MEVIDKDESHGGVNRHRVDILVQHVVGIYLPVFFVLGSQFTSEHFTSEVKGVLGGDKGENSIRKTRASICLLHVVQECQRDDG